MIKILPDVTGRSNTSILERALKYYREEGLRPVLSLAALYGPSLAYHRRMGMWSYNQNGLDIFAADWDNLILLDACRYDYFIEKNHRISGMTERKESRASSTSEFIRANFTGRELHDVVYVSANPWFAKLREDIDASVFDYYDVHNEPEERPHVDQMYLTTELAIEAASEHPNKRLLVHYAPPHHPLFGPTAEEHLPSVEDQLEMGFYDRIRRGEIEVEDGILRQAYTETLDVVVEEVMEVLKELVGKTVISSDHGEMLGERAHPIPFKYYGHVPGLYTKELVTVPWHICDHEHRKTTVAERPVSTERQDGELDQKLRDLGYKV